MSIRRQGTGVGVLLTALALLWLLTTAAARADSDGASSLDRLLADYGAHPLNDQILDQHRGGFTTRDGIMIALGIADLIRVDGHLVAEQAWQIDPLSLNQLLTGTAQNPATVTILRAFDNSHGLDPQNTAVLSSLDRDSLALTTLIQNTRDGRVIETLRTINIDVSNLRSITPQLGLSPATLREFSILSFQ